MPHLSAFYYDYLFTSSAGQCRLQINGIPKKENERGEKLEHGLTEEVEGHLNQLLPPHLSAFALIDLLLHSFINCFGEPPTSWETRGNFERGR